MKNTIHPKIKKEVMQYAETDPMLPFLFFLFRISMLHENKLKNETMQVIPISVCEKELSFKEKNRSGKLSILINSEEKRSEII